MVDVGNAVMLFFLGSLRAFCKDAHSETASNVAFCFTVPTNDDHTSAAFPLTRARQWLTGPFCRICNVADMWYLKILRFHRLLHSYFPLFLCPSLPFLTVFNAKPSSSSPVNTDRKFGPIRDYCKVPSYF